MQMSMCGPWHSPHSLVLQTVCTTPDRLQNRLLYWDSTHTHTHTNKHTQKIASMVTLSRIHRYC